MNTRKISILTLLDRQRAWLAGIPLVIALVAASAAVVQSHRQQTFQTEGIETRAQVLNTRESVRRIVTGDGSRRERQYFVEYRFDTADGVTQQGEARVTASFYRDTDPGDTVPIQYMPDDPEQIILDQSWGRGFVWAFSIVALISLGIAGYAIRHYWRRTAAMLRAARRGTARQANVIDHLPSRTRIGDEPAFWRLHWRDETGGEGESLNQGRMWLMAHGRIGDTITVLVDPVSRQSFWDRDLHAR